METEMEKMVVNAAVENKLLISEVCEAALDQFRSWWKKGHMAGPTLP